MVGVRGSSTSETPDPALLERMTQGDASALGQLYDRHAKGVYSLALRVLRNPQDAEDVVQEVFAQSWRIASRYDPSRASVSGWLTMQAKSRAIDRLRGRQSRHAHIQDAQDGFADRADPAAGPDVFAVQADDTRRVRLALLALPALQRSAIELAYYEGLTHAEIAGRLEQPLGTVKTRIRQGLLTLRGALSSAAVSTP